MGIGNKETPMTCDCPTTADGDFTMAMHRDNCPNRPIVKAEEFIIYTPKKWKCERHGLVSDTISFFQDGKEIGPRRCGVCYWEWIKENTCPVRAIADR